MLVSLRILDLFDVTSNNAITMPNYFFLGERRLCCKDVIFA